MTTSRVSSAEHGWVGESESATLQYHHAGLSPRRVKMGEAADQYERLPFPRELNVEGSCGRQKGESDL
jgi:hypothetical protein